MAARPMAPDLISQVIALMMSATTLSAVTMLEWDMKSAFLASTLVAALMAASAHAGIEVGDYSTLPKDLARAATDYDLAQFKADRTDLDRLLANDYILAGSTGRSQTKAEYLADALAPGSKTLAVALDIRVRKVWDTGAVLGGVVDAKGLKEGKEFTFKGRFVDVWEKRDGKWQVVFSQIDTTQ